MADQSPAALLRAAAEKPDAEVSLTDNELAVLRGAADGETYAETARRIFLTEKSVSNVAIRVMRKLDAKTMAQAVHLAHQAGLLRRERHGDHAGYTAHLRRGERPCGPCRLGERAYRNAQRAGREAA
ncbi:helix-turn-helix transcriptional regulator [Streptomyces sp. NPDC097640]|uniref:response regulator transcription factor n=1 Tax=Streptomyces sp. NPDC097640 TaxID=3157229 RepID=UPI00332E9B93